MIKIATCLMVFACCMFNSLRVLSQEDTTVVEDYSMFGDATEVKRYTTQKVLNLSASKLLSAGLEWQSQSGLPVTNQRNGAESNNQIRAVALPRLLANFPVVSTDKLILNIGGQYWGTPYQITPSAGQLTTPLAATDANMLHSMGITTTVFKPFDEKRFLIVAAGADFNTSFPANQSVSGKAITVSASAIYGYKTNERTMWGIGASRTYRLGRLIHVPVLLWNKTFNDQWGMELLLPAKGFIRRNFSTKSLLLAGFELEGNQYLLPGGFNNSDLFLQRGEIKPRLQWERQLKNFIWLSAQAGARINGRFNYTDKYNGKDEDDLFRTSLKTALYFNLSINLVSP